ncbi:MAG TPA: sigma-70 family RNA polymerase sigma factor [Solirubrobacterales bacterium]|nr:sigma-70 family RNA polymerase sigma factor [Solirubrobacterales bacterium]
METQELQGREAADPIRNHLATERILWRRRDEDPRAKEELIDRYLPFAKRLAGRYINNREAFDDLFQVASVGLVNAVNRFDPDNGSSFAAFASPTINGELKRYFRDRIWLVRVPRGIQEEIHSVDRASEELGAELHRRPTREEVANRADLAPSQVDEAIRAKGDRIPVSLDLPVDGEERVPANRHGAEDPGFRLFEEKDEIRRAVHDLTGTERVVLRLRFIEDMTQTEIADRIGFSQMHVSRLLRRTLGKLSSRTTAD